MTADLKRWAESNYGKDVEVCGVSCLGRCDRAPAAIVNEQLFVGRDLNQLQETIALLLDNTSVVADTDQRWLDENNREWEIDYYRGDCTYLSVRKYLSKPDPEAVLTALETAGLLGMGGAGGRTYKKWSDVLKAKGEEKFVVCNADESEPGTFKDRDLLLAAPYLTIEGMILGGLVVGASRGWVYIRHEYPEQVAKIEAEIARAKSFGALGSNIFGSGRRFELEVFVSPGGYICGEQTALIEAMENKRAEPRNRPPELMTNGYQDQPTLLNNVETFAWVPAIMLREAGKWYADQGRKKGPLIGREGDKMRGRRFFSISGDVVRPGAYEVPTGIPLGELIEDYCGGMLYGKPIAAVALSGPSGGLLPAKIPVSLLNKRFVETCVPAGVKELDIRELPLDINISRVVELMIGAGIVIYAEGADVLEEALACSRFFRNESCGKCVPCRVGSQKITEMGEQLQKGQVELVQLGQFQETAVQLADVMKATSICGLGQVASNPVRSILTYFPQVAKQACGRPMHRTILENPT
jgi:formate dehydrogenase beta subunit